MNPFIFGKIVEKQHFCAREALLQELCNSIESGQNVVLYGRRRIGKSSLVFNACKEFPQRFPLFVDLFFSKDTAMFLEYCTNALLSRHDRQKGMFEKGISALKRIRPKIDIDPNTGTPSFSVRVSKSDRGELLHTIDDFFELLGTEFGEKGIIVCFDEFQSILNYADSDEVLARIRSKVQYHSFPYIFTGSDRTGLKSIFIDPKSPFYKSVKPIQVCSIPRDQFQPFLKKKFSEGKRKIDAAVWDRVFRLEAPGDIQQLCSALWDCSDKDSRIDIKILEAAYSRIFSQEIEGFQSTLASLTALQIRVLKYVAKAGTLELYSHETQNLIGASSSSIRRSFTALISKSILIKENDTVYFNNPFLLQFLNQRKI